MNGLDVLSCGPYVSVQDEGRPGHLRHGVSPGGAVDPLALEAGRLLVGNARSCAALEMLSLGGRFRAGEKPLRLALTGAYFPAHIDGRTIEPSCSFELRPQEVLDIGAARSGTYGYLSIAGGVDVPLVLGSRSTHIRAGFGGFKGRLLQAGDRLPLGAGSGADKPCYLPLPAKMPSGELRILWAAQSNLLAKGERQRFVETSFRVSHELDRMGVRLTCNEEPICVQDGLSALSGVVAMGDIQVPGTGRPVVLLNDRQPTGGYPRIATIIGADLVQFSRLPAGSRVNFKAVEEQEAVRALQELREEMASLPTRLCGPKEDPLSTKRLLSQNLISGVVAGHERKKDLK